MAKIIWKFSFCSLLFQWWFKFLKKMSIWFKKLSSVKKLPISNGEGVNFWPKLNIQNSAHTKPLNLEAQCSWPALYFRYKRRLGRIIIKTLFAQTILGKIFAAEWESPVKLDRARKIWYLLLCVFWLLLPKFNFWKGDWALYLHQNLRLFS